MKIQPKTELDALKECIELIYPNILKLFRMFYTLPVSTATPEKFSLLEKFKKIKTLVEEHYERGNIMI